ncbi:MAG: Asp-tRNA(Asn)/Glu-tRNA(Gln) amidotransferase subunit GatC [Promethearchaeota archaeon]
MPQNSKFSKKDLDKIAKLALLDVAEEEKEQLSQQLEDILNYFKKLDQLDTSNVEPTTHALDLKNVLREDKPSKSLSKKEILGNSKHTKDGYFKAPRILK